MKPSGHVLRAGLVKGADGRWDESVGFISVLRQEMPEGAPWVAVSAGIVLILIGLLNIVFPEKIWRWQHLLTVEGGEPTDFALSTNRFGGGLLVALGVFFLWAVVFG